MPVILELLERTAVLIGERVPAAVMDVAPLVFAIICFAHATALALGVPNRSWWRGGILGSVLLGLSQAIISLDELAGFTGRDELHVAGALSLLAVVIAVAVIAVRRISRKAALEP